MPPRRRGTTTAHLIIGFEADGLDGEAALAAIIEAATRNGATVTQQTVVYSAPALEGQGLPVSLIGSLAKGPEVYANLEELAKLTEEELRSRGMDWQTYRTVRLAMARHDPPLRPEDAPEIPPDDLVENLAIPGDIYHIVRKAGLRSISEIVAHNYPWLYRLLNTQAAMLVDALAQREQWVAPLPPATTIAELLGMDRTFFRILTERGIPGTTPVGKLEARVQEMFEEPDAKFMTERLAAELSKLGGVG